MSASIDPATKARAVTPSDATELRFKALYIGGAGNVAIIAKDDTAAVTFTGVTAGSILPVEGTKVMSTNTTATAIVALS